MKKIWQITEKWIDIWVNEEQFLKVPSLIIVIEVGIVIFSNAEQIEKAKLPIEVTEEWIVTCFNEEQL